MADQSRQIEFQKKLLARLQNKLAVVENRNAMLRAEIESMAHGEWQGEWGQWQEANAGVFGDGRMVGLDGTCRTFLNDRYQVAVFQPLGKCLLHLSIKRRDGAAIRDWRDMQRIKNELVSPEAEAVELYPAESRAVDGANQYHLWCIEGQFPFGFDSRLVSESEGDGVQQRPWQTDQRPDDLTVVDGAAMARAAGFGD